jgi:hypothetical protein
VPTVAMHHGAWVTPDSYRRFSNRCHHALASVSATSNRPSAAGGNALGRTQAVPINSRIIWRSSSRSKGLRR